MRIDIWSDVICPWCYLGHRRLAAALGQLALPDLEVRWRAFQLDPDAPRTPQSLAPVIEAKYGPGSFESMSARLGALGRAEDIDFRFDLARRVHTGDAHRLLAEAALSGRGDALRERLFAAYFTEGADLSSHEVLLAQAAATGMPASTGRAVLDSERHADVVAADQAAASEAGVTGVPAFLLDEAFLIPGAVETPRLAALIRRMCERST